MTSSAQKLQLLFDDRLAYRFREGAKRVYSLPVFSHMQSFPLRLDVFPHSYADGPTEQFLDDQILTRYGERRAGSCKPTTDRATGLAGGATSTQSQDAAASEQTEQSQRYRSTLRSSGIVAYNWSALVRSWPVSQPQLSSFLRMRFGGMESVRSYGRVLELFYGTIQNAGVSDRQSTDQWLHLRTS